VPSEFFYGANNVNLLSDEKIGAEISENSKRVVCDPPQFLQEVLLL
jgi:hypothetical protein